MAYWAYDSKGRLIGSNEPGFKDAHRTTHGTSDLSYNPYTGATSRSSSPPSGSKGTSYAYEPPGTDINRQGRYYAYEPPGTDIRKPERKADYLEEVTKSIPDIANAQTEFAKMIRLEEQLDRQRQIQAQREVYRGTDESKLFQEGILAAARRGAPDIVGPSKFQPTDYGKVTEAIKQLGEYLNYNDQSNWEVPATPSVPYTHRNIEMPTNVRNYDLLPQGDKFDYMDSIKDQSDWQTPKGVNWDAILDVFRTPKVEAYGYPDTPLRSQLDDMYAEQYGPMSKFRDTYGHDVARPISVSEAVPAYKDLEKKIKDSFSSELADKIIEGMESGDNIYAGEGLLRQQRQRVQQETVEELKSYNPEFILSDSGYAPERGHIAQDFYTSIPFKGAALPINAHEDMIVVSQQKAMGTMGDYVITYGTNTGRFYLYGHIDGSNPLRTVGDYIKAGDSLANMGYSGRIFSRGEEYFNGKPTSKEAGGMRPNSYVLHFEVMYDPHR